MPTLPLADWQSSLDDMETALTATLSALDRYQAGWQQLLIETAKDRDRLPQPGALDGIEARLQDWDARLAAAEDLAASVERQLTERESAVMGWQQAYTDWRELLQRREMPDTTSEAG